MDHHESLERFLGTSAAAEAVLGIQPNGAPVDGAGGYRVFGAARKEGIPGELARMRDIEVARMQKAKQDREERDAKTESDYPYETTLEDYKKAKKAAKKAAKAGRNAPREYVRLQQEADPGSWSVSPPVSEGSGKAPEGWREWMGRRGRSVPVSEAPVDWSGWSGGSKRRRPKRTKRRPSRSRSKLSKKKRSKKSKKKRKKTRRRRR